MEFLTRIEEILLLTIHGLGTDAYGVPIKERVEELLGRTVSVGSIYVPLDRLAKRGLLRTRLGKPSPERGGRGKKYYELTQEGLTYLRETKALNDLIWSDIAL